MTTKDDLPPLTDDLARVVERVRTIPSVSTEKRLQLQEQVFAAIQAAPVLDPGSTMPTAVKVAATSASAGASKVIGALVTGLIVGGGSGAWIATQVMEPRVVRVEVPMTSVRAGPSLADSPPAAADEFIDAPADVEQSAVDIEQSPVAPSPSRRRQSAAASNVLDLEEEHALIDASRAALSRGHAARALESLARHRREFPQGTLAEERDGLSILALSQTDPDTAASAFERFERRYPGSMLLPSIRRALRSPTAR